MIKLGLGYSFWNSAAEIPRGLDGVYQHVWKIYGIDGRYANFPGGPFNKFSTDGSRELVLQYPNSVVEKYYGYQTEKRQRYFTMAGEDRCEFLLVMDSDEYVHPDYNDWELFYRNLEKKSRQYPEQQCFCIKIYIAKDWEKGKNIVRRGHFQKYVRIHKNPAKQRYALGTHYYFCHRDDTESEMIRDKKEFLNPALEEYEKYTVDGVRFIIDSKMRQRPFLTARDGWAVDTQEDEEKYRYFLWVKYCRPIIFQKYPHLKKDPMMKRLP